MSGGTFALYSLLCRHGKFSLLPNQQAADEELSTYKYGPTAQLARTSVLKRFLEKHKMLRTALLIVVLFGACMVIGDGILTPAMSGNGLLWGYQECSGPCGTQSNGYIISISIFQSWICTSMSNHHLKNNSKKMFYVHLSLKSFILYELSMNTWAMQFTEHIYMVFKAEFVG